MCQWNCRELLHYIVVELCGFTYFAKHFQLTYYLLKRSILRASKRDLEREILITVGRDSTFFRRGTVSNCVADHCSDRHLEYNHLFWHALCLSLLYLKGLHQPLKQLSFFSLKSWNWFESLKGKCSRSRKSDCIIIMTDRSAVSVSICHGASMKKNASHVISLH